MRKYQGIDYTRNKVRIRDNYKCQDCGVRRTPEDISRGKYKRSLDVHHLNGLCGKKSQSYDSVKDMDGLITLCHKCHFNRPEHKCKKDGWNSVYTIVKNKDYQKIKKMRRNRYSLREIGNKYGVSGERIRQILLKL